MNTRSHPDSNAIDDWLLYGSKDLGISKLVTQLNTDQGPRLHEIEVLIPKVLKARIVEAMERQKL